MPFIADSRCGVWNIELNVGEICGELERMLEKEYIEGIKEGSKLWLYVSQIENALNKCDTMPDFWEWFLTDGEYNNVEMWNEIQDLFLDEDGRLRFDWRKVFTKVLNPLIWDAEYMRVNAWGLVDLSEDAEEYGKALSGPRDEERFIRLGY